MAKDHEVGVLFVHGMGEQGRGDTIGQMGEAIVEWLRRDSEGKTPTASIRHASLKESHPELSDAAEIHVSFDAAVSKQEKETGTSPKRVARWLLAESWWAGSFRPASYLETALWAISVGPWMIASQLDAIIRRTRNGPTRWVLIATLGLSAGVVAALIAPLAVLLLVVALLPIPGVRDFVIGVQRNLSGSYGDLSILVRSPVRFAGMWSTVLDDIHNLSTHCDRVVIVAHSQGSAISWMALRRHADILLAQRAGNEASAAMPEQVITAQVAQPPPVEAAADEQPRKEPVDAFISFGQALRKLKMLYLIHTEASFRERFFYLAASLVSTGALVVAFATVLNRIRAGGLAGDWGSELVVVGILALVILLIATLLAFLSRKWVDRTETELKSEAARVHAAMPGLEWVDMWASADPATNGPLFVEPPAWVSTFKVRNYGSTLLDHTTYWSNTTEFVSEIVERVNAKSLPAVIQPRNGADKRTSIETRQARVGMLVVARIAFFASLIASTLAIDATAIGNRVLEIVGGLIGQPQVDGPEALIGYAIWVVAGLAAWFGLLAAFNGIVSVDTSAYFQRRAPDRRTAWSYAWWVAIAVILLATGWFLVREADVRVLVGWALATPLGIALATTVLSGGGTTLAPAPIPRSDTGDASDPDRPGAE